MQYYGDNNGQIGGYGGQMRVANPTLSVAPINDPQSVEWYPVPPNNTVFLMDFNANKFYIKSKNEMGILAPLRIFDFKEIIQQIPQQSQQMAASTNTVTREEFEAQSKTLNELKQMLEDLTSPNK